VRRPPGGWRLSALAAGGAAGRSAEPRDKGQGGGEALHSVPAPAPRTVYRVPCTALTAYGLSQLRMQVINALAQRASSLTRVATIY
jgi:hypothetical protein